MRDEGLRLPGALLASCLVGIISTPCGPTLLGNAWVYRTMFIFCLNSLMSEMHCSVWWFCWCDFELWECVLTLPLVTMFFGSEKQLELLFSRWCFRAFVLPTAMTESFLDTMGVLLTIMLPVLAVTVAKLLVSFLRLRLFEYGGWPTPMMLVWLCCLNDCCSWFPCM